VSSNSCCAAAVGPYNRIPNRHFVAIVGQGRTGTFSWTTTVPSGFLQLGTAGQWLHHVACFLKNDDCDACFAAFLTNENSAVGNVTTRIKSRVHEKAFVTGALVPKIVA
jgi:hypothetical protein